MNFFPLKYDLFCTNPIVPCPSLFLSTFLSCACKSRFVLVWFFTCSYFTCHLNKMIMSPLWAPEVLSCCFSESVCKNSTCRDVSSTSTSNVGIYLIFSLWIVLPRSWNYPVIILQINLFSEYLQKIGFWIQCEKQFLQCDWAAACKVCMENLRTKLSSPSLIYLSKCCAYFQHSKCIQIEYTFNFLLLLKYQSLLFDYSICKRMP